MEVIDCAGTQIPRFVIFEGVDGVGKTTLATALARYVAQLAPQVVVYADAFPGAIPGTLGEWVYRFHHGQITDAPAPDTVAPAALQLLHVAAHVDTILMRLRPALESGGCVILDRYWWSTYAYSRATLAPEDAWPLVAAERNFLTQLPAPVGIYVSRQSSLKPWEVDEKSHGKLDSYYHEVMQSEQERGHVVYELENDASLENSWKTLVTFLELPAGNLPSALS